MDEPTNSLAAMNWIALCTKTGNGARSIATDPIASGAQWFYHKRH
jgi:hypothetical protein